ncbi:hypothetical protein GGG16DRAFT_109011 [Schizophyllum commune]
MDYRDKRAYVAQWARNVPREVSQLADPFRHSSTEATHLTVAELEHVQDPAAPHQRAARSAQPLHHARRVAHTDAGKGNRRMYSAQDVPKERSEVAVCGICFDEIWITHSPTAATSINTSDALPSGLRLPCPAEHPFCLTCLSTYIIAKLDPQHNSRGVSIEVKVFPIPCPSCAAEQRGGAHPAEIPDTIARRVLTAENMRLWDRQKRIENAELKAYCPNPYCSVLILCDKLNGSRAACPRCAQPICAACKATWHEGRACAAQQTPDDRRLLDLANEKGWKQCPKCKRISRDEDKKLYELARAKGWQQCPKCKRMVELKEGCNHMTCRCRAEFCYKCGSYWDVSAGRCTKRNSSCTFADEARIVNEPGDFDDARLGGHSRFPAGAPPYRPRSPQYAARAPNIPAPSRGYDRHPPVIPPGSPPFIPGAPVIPNVAPPDQGPPVIPLDGFPDVYRPAAPPFLPYQMYGQPTYYYGWPAPQPPW